MRLPILILGLAGSFSAAANAGSGVEQRIATLFPRGEERCYRASFGEMKKGQILESFQVYRLFRPNPEKEAIEASAEEQIAFDKGPEAANWASVTARLKGHDGVFSQSISCYEGEANVFMRCGVECDGGSFIVSPAERGFGIAFEEGSGLALNSSCGDPDDTGRGRWMTGEEAGQTITLKAEAPDQCLAEDRNAMPDFARNVSPLRERIGPGKWTCLSRTYDKAHLAKHPKQQVRSIAVAIPEAPAVETDESGFRTTAFKAQLQVVRRDGEEGVQEFECVADEFQFRCGEAFRLRRNDDKTAMLLSGAWGGDEEPLPTELAGVAIGADDLVFRLNGGEAGSCLAD